MHLALLVGTVVALLLAAFVLLVHFYSFFRIKSIKNNKVITAANQQVFQFTEAPNLKIGDTITGKKNTEEYKTHLSYYGCWQKLFVKSSNLKSHFSKVVFTGNKITSKTPNLYLENSNSPLILVGKTTLKGNVFLPKQGVRAGTIAGNYFQNSQLVFGKTNYSQSQLIEMDKQWISYVKNLYGNHITQGNRVDKLSSELKNAFKNETKIINQASPIILSQGKIHGNIIIKSATSITVNTGVSLLDIILIAPKIVIKDKVKGVFQAFAQNYIKVGENCKLNFPSALVVYQSNKKKENSKNEIPLEIGKRSIVQGSIVFLKEKIISKKRNRRGVTTHLKIHERARIDGEVYCQGNMELLGAINGSCYTKKFVANQLGSKYINHLYNSEIKPFTVEPYGGLPFEKVSKKSIVKWLY